MSGPLFKKFNDFKKSTHNLENGGIKFYVNNSVTIQWPQNQVPTIKVSVKNLINNPNVLQKIALMSPECTYPRTYLS